MGNRIYWAVQAAALAPQSTESYVTIHGLQSVGITTSFNLEQVFELGQLAIYENIEEVPDVEINMEKVVDGYPLMIHLATRGYATPTLAGRSGRRCNFAMNIYDDSQESASGVQVRQVNCSGMYWSSWGLNCPVDGNITESLGLVGNNKVWKSSSFTYTGTLFDNTDAPLAATSGYGGVQRRENVIFDYSAVTLDANNQANEVYSLASFVAGTKTGTVLPPDIPGISSSGTNNRTNDQFGAHIANISVSADLGRDQINELGRKGPYFRFVNFPVEVTTDIEVTSVYGDGVSATEAGINADGTNLNNRTIKISLQDGTFVDLGTRNKLDNVAYGGGDAGGGNATDTYSYRTFNDLTIRHPQELV